MLSFCELERPSTLAESVEHGVLRYIQASNLKPGDALPKESELADGLNVSRNILREGLSGLKTLGLIESRKRRGMVLRRPNAFEGVRKLAKADYFSDDECRQFMQIRAIMELGMANFIYENRTEEDLRELRLLAGSPDIPPTIEEVINFHRKLFSLGGNFVADQFLKILSTAFKPLEPLTKDNLKSTPTHTEICDVLSNGTKEEFYKIMKLHLKPYLDTGTSLHNKGS
ncbi:MAG: FadR family transcriptional regulator [Oligosphaeraceae bacterium]|nr:FadR family transcriptional regulator [Oligosphaeraceae bacterium]